MSIVKSEEINNQTGPNGEKFLVHFRAETPSGHYLITSKWCMTMKEAEMLYCDGLRLEDRIYD